jgi:hypothetical protein
VPQLQYVPNYTPNYTLLVYFLLSLQPLSPPSASFLTAPFLPTDVLAGGESGRETPGHRFGAFAPSSSSFSFLVVSMELSPSGKRYYCCAAAAVIVVLHGLLVVVATKVSTTSINPPPCSSSFAPILPLLMAGHRRRPYSSGR